MGHTLKLPQVLGEAGVKKKRAHADIGGRGQARVDANIWFKI